MQPGQALNKNYQDFSASRQTFIRDQNEKEDPCLGDLPGQVCTSTVGRHLNNDCSMNNPGDIGDHSSAFAGMYESDANYKWRKVRGNLDLFVMERNERHLTSLQWKWQKMSKSRRRTPVHEGFYNETPGASRGDDVYKQMPESARTRSRAESRHKMREELDAYFYDRWKTADSRQQDRNNVRDNRVHEEQNETNPYQNAPGRDVKSRLPEYAANNEGQPQNNPYRNGVADTTKWSRHGYNPEQNFAPPTGNYPANYQNIPTRQPPYPGAHTRGLNIQEPFIDQNRRAEYLGTNLRHKPYSQQQQNVSNYNQNASANCNPYLQENQIPYDPYSSGKARYPHPAYPPCDPGYPNYGYTPEYGTPSHYPHPVYTHQHHHPDYQYSPALIHEGKVATPYADPWIKKDIPTCAHHCGTKSQESAPYSFQQSRSKTDRQLHDNSSSLDGAFDNKYSNKNVSQSQYLFPTEQEQPETESKQYRSGRLIGPQVLEENNFDDRRIHPMSRRQKRMFADVSTVNEEVDDDVFLSPVMSPEQKYQGHPPRFSRNGVSTPVSETIATVARVNASVAPTHNEHVNNRNRVIGDEIFDDISSRRFQNEKQKFRLTQKPDSVDKLSNQHHASSLLVNSRPQRNSSMSRFSISPESDGISSVPVPRNYKLPPLQAEHLGSVVKASCTTTPYLTPGSSTLSDDRNKQGTKRNKGSGKRVVFAKNSFLEESLSSPKREKLDLEGESVYVKSSSVCGANPSPELETIEPETPIDKLSDKNRKSSDSSHHSNVVFLDVKPSVPSNQVYAIETNEVLQDKDISRQLTNESGIVKNAPRVVTPKHEREVTTINVGDIDVKSDISLPQSSNSSFASISREIKSEKVQVSSLEYLNSDKSLLPTHDLPLPTEAKSESDEPEIENRSIASDDKSSKNNHSQVILPKALVTKSKSSLWKLAKNIQRRVGTKLHLRRGESQSSASEECLSQSKAPPVPATYNNITFLSDNDSAIPKMATSPKHENLNKKLLDVISNKNKTIDVAKPCQANAETKIVTRENTSNSAFSSKNATIIESQTHSGDENFDSESQATNDVNSVTDGGIVDSGYKEIVNEGKIEDLTTCVNPDHEALNVTNHSPLIQSDETQTSVTQDMATKEQANTEKYIYEEEIRLEEQRKNNEEIKNKLMKEQHEMEYEIHNLKKLLMTKKLNQEDSNCMKPNFNDKLEALERQIADLDNKLTDTSNKLKENEIETQNLISKTSMSPGGGIAGLPPDVPGHPLFILSDPHSGAAAAVTHGAYTEGDQESSIIDPHDAFMRHRRESIDHTLAQQENFKAELELQMANMKTELEKQMKEQNGKVETSTDNVIDVRVTNLEKQIEEMNKKIQSAEAMICKTEKLRKKELEGKSSHPEKSTNHSKKHHDHHQHPRDDVKRLISQLSLSPKVTPAPDRKTNGGEKKVKLHKTSSLETDSSSQQLPRKNVDGDDVKQVQNDDTESDDEVIILDDASLENTIVTPHTSDKHISNDTSRTDKQMEKNSDVTSCAADHSESTRKDDFNAKLVSTSLEENQKSSLPRGIEAQIESEGSQFVVELTMHQCDSSDEQENISKFNENESSVQVENLKPDSFVSGKEIIRNNAIKENKDKSQDVEILKLDVLTALSDNTIITKSDNSNAKTELKLQTKKDDLNSRCAVLSQHKRTNQQHNEINSSQNMQLKEIRCTSVQEKKEVPLQSSSFINTDSATRNKPDQSAVPHVETKQSGNENESNNELEGAKPVKAPTENIKTNTKPTTVTVKPITSPHTPFTKSSESQSKPSAIKKAFESKESDKRPAKENVAIDNKVSAASVSRKYLSSEKDNGKGYGSLFTKPSSKQSMQTNLSTSRSSSRKAFATNPNFTPTTGSRNFRRGSIVDGGGQGSLVEKYRLKSQLEKKEEEIDESRKIKLEKPNKFESKDATASVENANKSPKKASEHKTDKVEEVSDAKDKKSFFGEKMSKLFSQEKKKTNDSALKSLLKIEKSFIVKPSVDTKAKPKKQTTFVVEEFKKSPSQKEKGKLESKATNQTESSKTNQPKPAKGKSFYASWFSKGFKKGKQTDEIASETTSSDKQQSASVTSPKASEQNLNFSSGRKSTMSADITSDISSLDGSKESHGRIKSRGGHLADREVTITSVGSGFTQVQTEDASQVQIPSSSCAAERGWEKSESRQSLLYGLGTNWCICPKPVWKYLGDENDEEPITRRKCISIIMGSVLAFLLLAVVLGLIIGLATSGQAPTDSPIRFVVIQGDNEGGGA